MTQTTQKARRDVTARERDGLGEYGTPPDMIQYQFRIPPELKKALEDTAERLTEKYGVPVSTSAVLRKFIAEGLKRAREQR